MGTEGNSSRPFSDQSVLSVRGRRHCQLLLSLGHLCFFPVAYKPLAKPGRKEALPHLTGSETEPHAVEQLFVDGRECQALPSVLGGLFLQRQATVSSYKMLRVLQDSVSSCGCYIRNIMPHVTLSDLVQKPILK